jgi:hypothetical protein
LRGGIELVGVVCQCILEHEPSIEGVDGRNGGRAEVI